MIEAMAHDSIIRSPVTHYLHARRRGVLQGAPRSPDHLTDATTSAMGMGRVARLRCSRTRSPMRQSRVRMAPLFHFISYPGCTAGHRCVWPRLAAATLLHDNQVR